MLLTNAVWQSEFGPSVVLLQILYPVWGPRPPGAAGKGLQCGRQRCQGEICAGMSTDLTWYGRSGYVKW